MKKMKKGERFRLEIGDRYYRQNRSIAVPDIYAALVEIITNCDDSYGRMHQKNKNLPDGGDILIEIQRHIARPSLLIVKDRAEGITLEGMREKFGTVGGEVTAGEGLRGYMARGLKDCTHLGEIRVDSIVEGKHYACRLTRDPTEFCVEETGMKARASLRKDIGIERKNGTKITLEYEGAGFPQFSSVKRMLPLHYALRNIFAKDGPSKVLIRRNESDQPERLVFPPLQGKLVVDEPFDVKNYPEAEGHLKIWKAPQPLPDEDFQFRRSGILVTSGRGIHQCTLFEHEHGDEFAKHYYGRLECSYIATLLREFDESEPTESNPFFLLDPSRRQGLDPKHPFTKAFFAHPKKCLTKLIEQDRQAQKEQQNAIANDDLQRKFDKVGKLMDKVWKQYIGEDEATPSEERALNAAHLNGIFIYPPRGFKIRTGETRYVTVYISSDFYNSNKETLMQIQDEKIIKALDKFSRHTFKPHPKAPDIVYGSCKIEGASLGKTSIIVRHGEDLHAETEGEVVKKRKEEDWEFEYPLEFERPKCDIPEGETRSLRILGDISKIGKGEKTVRFSSSDDGCVTVMGGGRCSLTPRQGFNYAEGQIKIKGSALTEGRSVIVTAHLDDWSATIKIHVRLKKNFGSGFKLELVPQKLGAFRARWKLYEQNVLQISAAHPSIKPYLGAQADGWPGQNRPHCQMLLAEIVVEAFCNKLLGGEMQTRSSSFQFSEEEPSNILHILNLEFHKKVNELAFKIHKVFLPPDCFD